MLNNVLQKIDTLPTWIKALLLLMPTLVLIVVGVVLAVRLVFTSDLLWAFFIVLVGVIALVTLWRLPKWQVKNLRVENAQDEHKKFELENEVRKTIAQILGGLLVLLGLFFTAKQLYIAQEAQTVAREAQLDAQESRITERFDRATGQLASDSLEIRVGGIFAFQRIAKDSEPDFDSVYAILQAFVRDNAPRNEAEEDYPRSTLNSEPNGVVAVELPQDIEAAIAVLVNLAKDHNDRRSLDLHGTDLEGVIFNHAAFNGTLLFDSNLQYAFFLGGSFLKADFSDSNLRGANFWGGKFKGDNFQRTGVPINLSEANFQRAQSNDAEFEFADLKEAKFQDAKLYNAQFTRANLTGATFQGANLNEAEFLSVDLSEANFQDVQLESALLCNVDLSGAKNLTQSQLDATDDGVHVKLPEGLHAPSLWRKADTMHGPHGYCLH